MKLKMTAFCIAMMVALIAGYGGRALAAEDAPSAADLREAARLAMEAGRFDQAIEGYSRLREIMPQAAEIPYNMAVAEYRRGDYARAAELFDEAITLTGQDELRNRATYNLGNTAYAQSLEALQDQGDPQQAMAGVDNATGRLEEAMKRFKQALAADSEDEDARVNAELAHRLLQQLQQLQEQMQQQQDQQQQDQDQQSDDQQQQQDQQQQGQQESDEQQQQQQQQQEQQQGESEQEQSRQQQAEQEQSEQQQQQQAEQSDAEQQEEQAQAAEQQQQEEGDQRRQMTREEAERLLQRVRDKERQRREELARRQRGRYKSAEKDW